MWSREGFTFLNVKELKCNKMARAGCPKAVEICMGRSLSAHLANMNVITHPWENENGFVGMGSTISRTRLGGDGGRLSPFHYTQASAIMKAILIGFNACGGARSCYLMALTKEYESVIIKPHSPAVLHAHWSSFTILPFWRWRKRFSSVREQPWDWNVSVHFRCFCCSPFSIKLLKLWSVMSRDADVLSSGAHIRRRQRFESEAAYTLYTHIIHSKEACKNR